MRDLTGAQLDSLKKLGDYSYMATVQGIDEKTDTITSGNAMDYASLEVDKLQDEEYAEKRSAVRAICMLNQELADEIEEIIPGIKDEIQTEQQRLQRDANIGTMEKMFSSDKRKRRAEARERIEVIRNRKAQLDNRIAIIQQKVAERSTDKDAAGVMAKVNELKSRYYSGHSEAVKQNDTATIIVYHGKSTMDVQAMAARIYDNTATGKKNKAIQKRVNKTEYKIAEKEDGTAITVSYKEGSVYRDLQAHFRKYDDTTEIPDSEMEDAFKLHQQRQDEIHVLETGHHIYSPKIQEPETVIKPILESVLKREEGYMAECAAFYEKHKAIFEGTASNLEVVNAVEDFTLFHQKAQLEMYMGGVLRKSATVKNGSPELKKKVLAICANNSAMCDVIRDVIEKAGSIQKYYQGEVDEIKTVQSFKKLRDGLLERGRI